MFVVKLLRPPPRTERPLADCSPRPSRPPLAEPPAPGTRGRPEARTTLVMITSESSPESSEHGTAASTSTSPDTPPTDTLPSDDKPDTPRASADAFEAVNPPPFGEELRLQPIDRGRRTGDIDTSPRPTPPSCTRTSPTGGTHAGAAPREGASASGGGG